MYDYSYSIEIYGKDSTGGITRAISIAKLLDVESLKVVITRANFVKGERIDIPLYVHKDSNFLDIEGILRAKLEIEDLKKKKDVESS